MTVSDEWTFLTNHAHVLLSIARDPDVRLREVAVQVGITERAAQRIVSELEESGFLERARVGRRNRYVVHADRPLRHPMDRAHAVSELLGLLSAESPPLEVPLLEVPLLEDPGRDDRR
ncbi:MAG: helix-turn-helix transcriptional regulator [Actinomycetota bacterium]